MEVDLCDWEEKQFELELVKLSVLSWRNWVFFLERIQKKRWVDFQVACWHTIIISSVVFFSCDESLL
jgi:hypothetical protein